jgi:histidinol dehydrogenase
MKVNRHILEDLGPDGRRRLTRRAQSDLSAVEPVVREIVADVQNRGDRAVVEHTAKLDGASLEPDRLLVADAEFDEAAGKLDPTLLDALERAVSNVRAHHERQLPEPTWMHETVAGVIAGERLTPIASAGLYVPRGKGSFPSVMMMLCIPAVLAAVPRVVVCTPPNADGSIDPASLVVAQMCGVRAIFKVGGAQAIAAMAFGTESIPKVEKIVGPGNQYVAAARRLVFGHVDPGAPAGPSESIVLCDRSADPEIAAREILVECEHGPDSAGLLVTDSPALADDVEKLLPDLLASLPQWRREFCEAVLCGFGGIVVTSGLEDSIAFTNEYAPEHLRILTAEPFDVLPKILHAGEVLLGDRASIAFGNFAIGVNAILPTGGTARSYSGVGVQDFLKRSSFAYVSAEGAARIGPMAAEIARYEGFDMHVEAAVSAQRRGRDAERGWGTT